MQQKLRQLRAALGPADTRAAPARAVAWPHERTLTLWLAFAAILGIGYLAAVARWKAALAAPGLWEGMARLGDGISRGVLLEAAVFGVVGGGALAGLLAGLVRERARRRAH